MKKVVKLVMQPTSLVLAVAMLALTGCATAPQTVDDAVSRWKARAEERSLARWKLVIEKKYDEALTTYSEASKTNYSKEAVSMYAQQLGPSEVKIKSVDCKANGCDVTADLKVNVKVPRGPVLTHFIPIEERWVLEKGDLFFVRKL